MDYEISKHLIFQLRYLGDLVLLIAFAGGISLVVLGVMLIPSAARPMTSTSWFGRQINPGIVVSMLLSGTMLIVLLLFIDIGGGIILKGGFDSYGDHPLNWHDQPIGNKPEEVMRTLLLTFFRVFGLAVIVFSIFSIPKILTGGGQGPTYTGISIRLITGFSMLVPDRVAQGLANMLPLFEPISRLFGSGLGSVGFS